MRQEANLRETLNIGQDIMKRCHPDAVPVMKQWLSSGHIGNDCRVMSHHYHPDVPVLKQWLTVLRA